MFGLCVCVCVGVCSHITGGACEGQSRTLSVCSCCLSYLSKSLVFAVHHWIKAAAPQAAGDSPVSLTYTTASRFYVSWGFKLKSSYLYYKPLNQGNIIPAFSFKNVGSWGQTQFLVLMHKHINYLVSTCIVLCGSCRMCDLRT